jgi:quinol monooxygenase YgiN
VSYPVFAEIPVKPEYLDDPIAAVRGIVSETLAEDGCEQFLLHRAADGSARLFIYERWRDRAAFEFHHAQPYTLSVYKSYETWLAGPVTITELTDAN